MSKSIRRVTEAAAQTGLEIEVVRFGESTRTAEEAAARCACHVSQIVKSLIFRGKDSGRIVMFLVPGDKRLDPKKAEEVFGESVDRADPALIRERTGFAIGGVSPLGSIEPVALYAAEELMLHDQIWAAAGAHDAVFRAEPRKLMLACGAKVSDITA